MRNRNFRIRDRLSGGREALAKREISVGNKKTVRIDGEEKMKAYVLHGIGNLQLEEVLVPGLEKDRVLLEVKAAGVCGSDIPRVFETGTYHFPTIPGHEFSGIVRETENPKDAWLIGKKAGVFPLIPCRTCESCQENKFELCRHYDYLGSRSDGGFAEFVSVPVWNVLPLPEELSFEAAAMLEPVSVAQHAVRQAEAGLGDHVAIFGPGTIGLLMAQWFRMQGASRVYLIGTREEQGELARKLGFPLFFNSKQGDAVTWLMEQTEGTGVDIAVEGVGSGEVLAQCLRSAAPSGKILAVGNPKGEVRLSKEVYWMLLRKQLKLYGTWNSSYGDMRKNDWVTSVEALLSGQLKAEELITHRLSFENLFDGLEIMKDKSVFSNKVMITR